MRSTRWIAQAARVAGLVLLTFGPALRSGAQTDAFEQLKSYDYQNRQSVSAISKMVQEAGLDKARLADIETRLIGVIGDANASVAGKQEACRFLWIVGTGKSVPALAAMLEDEKLTDMARYALERNPDPSAAKAMRAALAGASGERAAGLINSLGNRADPLAVGALKPLAAGPDKLVADAAVAALGKIGNAGAVSVLRSLPKDNLLAGQALLRCASRAEATRKAEAARVYEEAVSAGRPGAVRAAAMKALIALGAPRGLAAGLAFAKSGDTYLAPLAARACAMDATPQDQQRILHAYAGLAAPLKVVMLTAWGQRREPAAAGAALEALASADASLRLAAIDAAARVAGGRAVPALIGLATKGEGGERQAARTALLTIPGKDADDALLRSAQQGQGDEKALALGVLSERGSPAAARILLEAAQGSDPTAAAAALKVLADSGGPEVHADLVRILATSGNEGVRDAAGSALISTARRIGDPNRAVGPLLAALPSAPVANRCAAMPVLAEIGGDRALAELEKAASSPDAEVKRAAVSALADTWSDDRAAPTLLALAKSGGDRSTRILALRGYIRIVGQVSRASAQSKAASLKDAMAAAERPEEKRLVLAALRDCRVPQALEVAGACLDDPALFQEASDVVLYLGTEQKQGRRTLPAVSGPATKAAAEKIVRLATDANLRAQAEKLR